MYATGELKDFTLEITVSGKDIMHHIAELYLEMRHRPITGYLIVSMFLLRIITILLVRIMTLLMTTSTTMCTWTRNIFGNNHHMQVRFLTTLAVYSTYIHTYCT